MVPRAPPGFHQGPTRVPPGFHSARAAGWSGWFEVRFHSRVPPGFHQQGSTTGSTRVPRGFKSCGVVRGTEFCKDPTRVPQGSTRFTRGSARLRGLIEGSEDRFAHGRNTKQNRHQWFSAHFHCFDTCSVAQTTRKCWLCSKSDHVAAGPAVQLGVTENLAPGMHLF